MVNIVGICSFDEIDRHKKHSHITPLEKIIYDVWNGTLSVIKKNNEGWNIYQKGYNENYRKIDTCRNRRELYLKLSNRDLGCYYDEGSYGLYKHILNLNEEVEEWGDILISRKGYKFKYISIS